MKRLSFIAVLGWVAFSAPAGATNGMRLTGFGPVQNSMGGVGVGATLDSASVLSNPAGLVDLGPRVDLGGQYFKPNVEYSGVESPLPPGFGQQLHDTSTAPGIGGTIGVKITPSRMLSIGVAWESRSYFRDFSFDIPAHTGVDPATFQPVTFPAGQDKLAFDQPMVATVGAAVTPIDELLVAADVQWINWADTNGANKPPYSSNAQATGAMPWNLDWRNQWVFKLGLQVTPMERLRLRAGYNYGMMPLRSGRAFENIAFPAVAEHHLTAGAGYDFTDKLTVNAGGMYAPKATLNGANATYPSQGGQAIQSYTTAMSQYALDLGVGYRF